jgi:hypothetical protein
MTPFIGGSYSNVKGRPGFEIDSRVRVTSQSVGLGAAVKLSARTALQLSGSRSHLTYDDQAVFLGEDLSNALDQTTNAEQLQLRYRMTALTTFVVTADALQDRFEFDRLRSSNTIRVMPGFELKPSALISGKAAVGYRQFDPLTATVQPFRGPVASVGVKYTARATQIGVGLKRDLAYSYQDIQPYYVLTDLDLSITERFAESWDVFVRGGQQRLDYVRVLGVPPLGSDGEPLPLPDAQHDRIRQYSGGIGFRVGRTLRVGVEGSYMRRQSSEGASREFEGLRVGASISYGSSQ